MCAFIQRFDVYFQAILSCAFEVANWLTSWTALMWIFKDLTLPQCKQLCEYLPSCSDSASKRANWTYFFFAPVFLNQIFILQYYSWILVLLFFDHLWSLESLSNLTLIVSSIKMYFPDKNIQNMPVCSFIGRFFSKKSCMCISG